MDKIMGNANMETKSRAERKYRRLNIFFLMGVFVFSAIIILSIAMLTQSMGEYAQGDEAYAKLRNDAAISDGNQSGKTQATEEASSDLPVLNFPQLLEKNSDFCCWIYQKGTTINYPVVRGDNNEYYLTHLFSGTVNKMGCLFMDYRNANDFSDENTVIYGHEMKNNSMFHSIVDYIDPDVYVTRPTMMIYTKNKTYTLELFAGNIVSGDSQFVEFSFVDDDSFMDYVNKLKANSTFKSNVEVVPGDKLVTLVTCTSEFKNARYELVGKLVSEAK